MIETQPDYELIRFSNFSYLLLGPSVEVLLSATSERCEVKDHDQVKGKSPSSNVHSGLGGRFVPGVAWTVAWAWERTQVEQGRLASLYRNLSE